MEEEKHVVVTGASQGIGRAIAERLLRDGYGVTILARDAEKLRETASVLTTFGKVDAVVVDLASKEAIAQFTSTWNTPLYALINNAGICKTARIDEEVDVFNEVVGVNLEGSYRLTHGLLSHLVDGGRIVNIASQLGVDGRAGYGAYAASKFGLIGLTKCWAKELGGRGITANAICPGWVWSEMTDVDMARLAKESGVDTDAYHTKITDQLELGVFNQPEDIAGLASYLLSPDAVRVSGREWLLQNVTN